MKIQIISLGNSQPKLHQFTPDELVIVKLGSNPSKFDELIFKSLKRRRRIDKAE